MATIREVSKMIKTTKIAAAEQAGRDAFHRGIECASCLDPAMCGKGNDTILTGVKVGEALPILKAWNRGWIDENLRAPLPEVLS